MQHYNYHPSMVTALPSTDTDEFHSSFSKLQSGSSVSPSTNPRPSGSTGTEDGGATTEVSFFEASPVKMLTTSRGRKEFTGPAKSIMNHYGYHPSLVTLPRLEMESASSADPDTDLDLSNKEVEVIYEDEDGDQEKVLEDVEEEEEEEEDETVYMDCICDVNVTTNDWVIKCDNCQRGFHVECVDLDEQVSL